MKRRPGGGGGGEGRLHSLPVESSCCSYASFSFLWELPLARLTQARCSSSPLKSITDAASSERLSMLLSGQVDQLRQTFFLPIYYWRCYSPPTQHGDGTLLSRIVGIKDPYVWTHVLSPPSFPSLPPWCSHMHGLGKWQRPKRRVVFHCWALSELKNTREQANTFSTKLQAAASLCCAYKVPVPPTSSPDQKPAWLWCFLKPPKARTACVPLRLSLPFKTWTSLWYVPSAEKPLLPSSHENCLCGKGNQKWTVCAGETKTAPGESALSRKLSYPESFLFHSWMANIRGDGLGRCTVWGISTHFVTFTVVFHKPQ